MRRRSFTFALAVAVTIVLAPAHAESSLPELSPPPPSSRFT